MAQTRDLLPEVCFDPADWATATASDATRHLLSESERSLASYRAKPSLVREHANIERATAQGGYGHRQLYELIQNGADALIGTSGGRVSVVLTDEALYCANEGEAIDEWGVEALLSSHVSMKRGTEIGRFGLGFKSVLGISSNPQFFSRSACFGFDADTSSELIRGVVPDAERTPVLRVAHPLDPIAEAEKDETLRELMAWATTVVKLPRTAGDSSWLSDDSARFPAPFLLFSPHVDSLILDDRVADISRHIQVQIIDGTYLLLDNDDPTEWRVFATVHEPSPEARADAGELSERKELPLIWAVPMHTRRRRGSFWAFFPTEYEMTLPGILNAPWKTNEDRQNLLQGIFNDELIDAAAALVVERLPDLSEEADPGQILEYLPGRLEESPHWADRRLNATVYDLASRQAVVPNIDGVLSVPTSLSLHPSEAGEDALSAWASYPGRPSDWCHHSIATRDRRARVERLFGQRTWATADVRTWLEAVIQEHTPPASVAAVCALGAMMPGLERRNATYRLADIVLTENGTLVPPDPTAVFLHGERDSSAAVVYVHEDLARHEATVEALSLLGIGKVDAVRELEALLNGGSGELDWDAFWSLTRAMSDDEAAAVVESPGPSAPPIHVRVVAGPFVPIETALLPGKVVPEDRSRDETIAIDTAFHKPDLGLLHRLGMSDGPTATGGSLAESWCRTYLAWCRKVYEDALTARHGRPQQSYIVLEQDAFPGPISPMFKLSQEGVVAFTSVLLGFPEALQSSKVVHKTRRNAYPVVDIQSPTLFALSQAGRLMTSLGPRPLRETVGRNLRAWSKLFPVATLSHSVTAALELPNRLEELDARHWEKAFERVEQDEVEPSQAGRLYALSARSGVSAPSCIVCWSGGTKLVEEPASVTVVVHGPEWVALDELGIPLLPCSRTECSDLEKLWGLSGAGDKVSSEVIATPTTAISVLADEFPFLRSRLPDPGLRLSRCSLVRLVTSTANGTRSEVVHDAVGDSCFYWTDDRDDVDLLETLLDRLDVGLSRAEILEALKAQGTRVRVEVQKRLDLSTDLAGRLLAVGGPTALRRRLPRDLLLNVENMLGPPSDHDMGELMVAVHGLDALKVMTPELERAGFDPPRQWSGSRAALRYVAELGFPREFAGFESDRRAPLLEVDGPVSLRPLHQFQRYVSDQLRAVVEEGGRGLLSLPTGAGKTRVAVQTLVEMIARTTLASPILWVAQTDELCEQAVQTWAEVWRAVGPPDALAISRLWARNEAEPIERGSQVVVATIAKLGYCLKGTRYNWLSAPSAVLIDEAHGSTTPGYTALLRWLDLGRGRSGRPLIGLTGTPFRGRSESAADRLAGRYGRRRLDHGAFAGDPHSELEDLGVLARVRHRILGGTELDLDAEELDYLRRTNRLPTSVEERIGSDADRNRVLLESITSLPDDWTVLVFTASVTHAQTLAALLSLRGVPSRAISADTAPAARRHYVEEFRSGRIRVLANYAVLTEGFDAPAVRAVYVGRPTFSPNRYQQMIGRGLRGPLNGGKEECLIVDVADNLVEFGGQLAFHDFDYLWDQS